jgi:hypothetical protein
VRCFPRSIYSNQNKPTSKANVKKDINDSASGKRTTDVEKDHALGKEYQGETSRATNKPKQNANESRVKYSKLASAT